MTAATQNPNPLPLEGVTVVSLEHAIAAPLATRHLADQGARVIKIERPGVGDFARAYDRRVEPGDHRFGAETGELGDDQRVLFAALRGARGVVGEARIALQLGTFEHALAEDGPFALVLQAEHHGAPVAGLERAVGIDRRVRGTGAARRLLALVGVVERETHPFHHAVEIAMLDSMMISTRRPRPLRARSSSAARMPE